MAERVLMASHPSNACTPMEVIPSDMITVVRADLLNCQGVYPKYCPCELSALYPYQDPDPAVKVIFSIFTQPENTGRTLDTTQSRPAGTVSSLMPEQSLNAL